MKRLIWLAGVTWALAQTVQATPSRTYGFGFNPTVRTAPPTLATTVAQLISNPTVNVTTATQTLSPLTPTVRGHTPFFGINRDFTPAPIIRNPRGSFFRPTTPTTTPSGAKQAVPDATATAPLLGMAFIGTALIRRKLAA